MKNETKATNITVLVEVLNSLKPYNFNWDISDIICCFLNLDAFDWLSSEDYKSAMDLFKYYGGSINPFIFFKNYFLQKNSKFPQPL